MAFETSLAEKHLTRTARRDPELIYNKFCLPELMDGTPGAVHWGHYFSACGIPAPGDINVDCPLFFTSMNSLILDANNSTIQ